MVHQLFVCAGGVVFQECLRFFGRGRQADEIEVSAAQQHARIGVGRRSELFRFELRQHKAVDFVTCPYRVANLRQRRLPGLLERPPVRHRPNPFRDRLHLFGRQGGLSERHARSGLSGEQLDETAFIRFAGSDYTGDGVDGETTAASFRGMAGNAVRFEDRPHLLFEDAVLGCCRGCEERYRAERVDNRLRGHRILTIL